MRNKIVFLFMSILFSGSSIISAAATSDQYLAAGDQFYEAKDFNKALSYYKAAVQADPQNWKAYQSLGSCEYGMGQRENAINDFQTSLNIHPQNPPLQNLVKQLSQTGTSPVHPPSSLPEADKLIWDVGVAGNIFSWQDLVSDWSSPFTTLTPPSSIPFGPEFDLGVDYTLTRNFQLGVQFQAIVKEAESVYIGSTGVTLTYSETCVGGTLVARYLISLGSDLNIVLHAEGGYFGLTGSNLNATNGTLIQTNNLNAGNYGGLLALETEWIQSGGWALDVGIGYRFLTFTPVTYTNTTSSSSPALPLPSLSNGNAYLGFSGPRVNVTVRLF
jgi:tetratricopeptide (TPR) repeat protein